jgi:hypothetical protein
MRRGGTAATGGTHATSAASRRALARHSVARSRQPRPRPGRDQGAGVAARRAEAVAAGVAAAGKPVPIGSRRLVV